jgi:adiponectin receptor
MVIENGGKWKKRLISYTELPSWSHDNDFILSGYRAPGGTVDELKSRNAGTKVISTATAKAPTSGTRSRKVKKANDTTGEEEIRSIEEHDSFWRCWESVWFYVHNETVNIHTHLWGAIVAIIAVGLHILGEFELIPSWLHPITHHSIFYPQSINPLPPRTTKTTNFWQSLLSRSDTNPALIGPIAINALITTPGHESVYPWHDVRARDNTYADWLGYASYLAGAITVLTCSATFHALHCHSEKVSKSYNKLDYIGIVAMIVGSFLPMIHYGFHCHPHLQLLYSIMIVSLGSAAAYTVLAQKFSSPAYRPIRTSVFIALGLSAIFPVTHILAMYGHETVSRTMGLHYLVAGGILYIVGACMYMARIPERFSPGKFDLFGASHQIFHILILFAAFCHYISVRRSHVFWHTVEAIDSGSGTATEAVCQAFDILRFSSSTKQ